MRKASERKLTHHFLCANAPCEDLPKFTIVPVGEWSAAGSVVQTSTRTLVENGNATDPQFMQYFKAQGRGNGTSANDATPDLTQHLTSVAALQTLSMGPR